MLAAVDVVVVPSRAETFSLTTAEAIACGALVVGPDEGAVADLVRGTGAGACFRAGDARSLADALIETLGLDPAARRGLGVEGRARLVERYTWSLVMSRIHDVYRETSQSPLRSCG